jgi:hypothetical protein
MKKSARVRLSRLGRLGLAIGFAGLAAGCASLPKFKYADDAPIDMSSPVAKDVMAADRNPGPYPRFAEIPKLPRDVRPAAAWDTAVTAVKSDSAELTRETDEIAAEQADTAGFAAQARGAVNVPSADVPTAASQAESAAYAKALRNRVKPPPKAH